ncbi:MAG: hypothetical protein RJS97_05135 [Parvibaculaceae bacterium]
MVKDSGMRIRIDRDLRERFIEICRAEDRPAAQVIREFMRTYVQEHEISNDERPDASHEDNKKGKGKLR